MPSVFLTCVCVRGERARWCRPLDSNTVAGVAGGGSSGEEKDQEDEGIPALYSIAAAGLIKTIQKHYQDGTELPAWLSVCSPEIGMNYLRKQIRKSGRGFGAILVVSLVHLEQTRGGGPVEKQECTNLCNIFKKRMVERTCLSPIPVHNKKHEQQGCVHLLHAACPRPHPHLLVRAARVALARVGGAEHPLQRQWLRPEAPGLQHA